MTKCLVCTSSFKSKSKVHKYCSIKCKKYAYYNKIRKGTIEKRCVFCDKQYIATQPHEKYCASFCQKKQEYILHKDRYVAYNKKIKLKNSIRESLRRASIKKAIPRWANFDLIKDVYIEAEYQQMQVDHIVPITSKKVCGLHCEDNLQLLTKHDNVTKNNKQWPQMPEKL